MSDHAPVEQVHGEEFTFLVRSDTDGRPYLVDLAAFKGNGVCQCRDFQVRKFGRLRRGEIDLGGDDELTCKHITRAQRFYARTKAREALKAGRVQDDSEQR